MLLKRITAILVLALGIPSSVAAQGVVVTAGRVPQIRIVSSKPLSIERGPLFEKRDVGSPTAARRSPEAQQPSERSWARRHPVALSAMIGAAGGALWGASECWSEVCGDGHGPLLVAFGAGVGAAIGAGVGFTISLAGR